MTPPPFKLWYPRPLLYVFVFAIFLNSDTVIYTVTS